MCKCVYTTIEREVCMDMLNWKMGKFDEEEDTVS